MNNSETVSKKAGRPKAFEDWEMALVSQFCDSKTKRGQQNWLYMQRAISELMFCESERAKAYTFLPSEADVMLRGAHLPSTLLSELGRMHPTDMHLMAEEISKRNLSERDALKFVRSIRNGRQKQHFDEAELAKVIARSIERYTETHDWTAEQLVASVQRVLEIVSKMAEPSR